MKSMNSTSFLHCKETQESLGPTLVFTNTIESGTFVNTAYPLVLHFFSGSTKYSDCYFKALCFQEEHYRAQILMILFQKTSFISLGAHTVIPQT